MQYSILISSSALFFSLFLLGCSDDDGGNETLTSDSDRRVESSNLESGGNGCIDDRTWNFYYDLAEADTTRDTLATGKLKGHFKATFSKNGENFTGNLDTPNNPDADQLERGAYLSGKLVGNRMTFKYEGGTLPGSFSGILEGGDQATSVLTDQPGSCRVNGTYMLDDGRSGTFRGNSLTIPSLSR